MNFSACWTLEESSSSMLATMVPGWRMAPGLLTW